MSVEKDKVIKALEGFGRDFDTGMKTFHESMRVAADYRLTVSKDVGKGLDMVNTASLALIKSGEAQERLGEKLLLITESHAKGMEALGDKFDIYAEEQRETQKMLGEIIGRQTLMSDGIGQLCAKIDASEDRQREAQTQTSDHETRITTIEALRSQTKDSKAGLIASIAVMIAALGLIITGYQALKTPPPPTGDRFRYENKPG